MPAGGSLGSLFFLSNSSNRMPEGAESSAPAEKPMMPILLVRIDVQFFGVRAPKPNRLLCVEDFIRLRIVAISAQPVAQDDRVDAVVVEERCEIGAFATHVQRVVPAPRRENHSRACVDTRLDRMDLDRRVVNADDAADGPRNRAAHVVNLGLRDLVLIQFK